MNLKGGELEKSPGADLGFSRGGGGGFSKNFPKF